MFGPVSSPDLSRFRLTKWYLDCIDESGAVCVAYWARLAFRGIAVSYSSVLHDGITREHLFSIDPPRLDGDSVSWVAEPLQCSYAMRRRAPGFATTLFDSAEGSAVWRCHMPSADVIVRTPTRELRGRGYAEVLELTIPPWRLPISELRWGRYNGEDLSLVWIDWKGARPLSVVLRNGMSVEGSVSSGSVSADDITLSIDDGAVIRAATIGDSVARIPLVRFLAPPRILRAEETKWSARGTILRDHQIVERGWTVHELVRFG